MESVMKKIRQAREIDIKKRTETYPTETIVDGCQVKLRFSTIGDNKIIPAIQSMLISSHLDAALALSNGGETA